MLKGKTSKLKAEVESEIKTVKGALDNHLDTINQNTSELQGMNDFMAELEAKLEKLSERMDQIDMLINPCMEIPDVTLNKKEQEVFMALYTGERITAEELSRRTGFKEETILNYINNLIAKGIPIIKEYIGGDILHSLNKKFKELQAKSNILHIVH